MADEKKKTAPKTPKKADTAVPVAKKAEGKKAKTEAKPSGPAEVMPKDYVPRLRKFYDEVVKAKLTEQFGYTNVMQVPKITKIVLNMGVGEATQDSKLVQVAASELEKIAGQKVVITKSRKAIAQFKIRENLAIGAKVTLRKVRMYEFLDRFINAALPRIRDFKGVSSKSFDGRGNYTVGIKEQVIFPEIEFDKVDSVHGLDIVIVTTAKTDEEGRALLGHLGMPYRK